MMKSTPVEVLPAERRVRVDPLALAGRRHDVLSLHGLGRAFGVLGFLGHVCTVELGDGARAAGMIGYFSMYSHSWTVSDVVLADGQL